MYQWAKVVKVGILGVGNTAISAKHIFSQFWGVICWLNTQNFITALSQQVKLSFFCGKFDMCHSNVRMSS